MGKAKEKPTAAHKRKPRARAVTLKDPDRPLSLREEAFVREYLIDSNGTQAAIRAGYAERGASVQAVRLLARASVQAAVTRHRERHATRHAATLDKVIERLAMIAFGDADELISHRRLCCRHCYGVGHRYQETQAERDVRHRRWTMEQLQASEEKAVAPFDELGGVGFDKLLPPVPDCPECRGEGVGDVVVADTRKLSPAARALYRGVKVTREGIEVKMADQDGALALLGKHLGLAPQRTELSGPNGKPIQVQGVKPADELTDAELEALARSSGN